MRSRMTPSPKRSNISVTQIVAKNENDIRGFRRLSGSSVDRAGNPAWQHRYPQETVTQVTTDGGKRRHASLKPDPWGQATLKPAVRESFDSKERCSFDQPLKQVAFSCNEHKKNHPQIGGGSHFMQKPSRCYFSSVACPVLFFLR